MSAKRILVTGASGFVGRHLLPALRTSFPSSTLIACGDAPVPEADVELELDLRDARSIQSCVADAKPDVVIHLAAMAAVSGSFADPMETWRVNADGSLILAHAIASFAPQALFVFVSSAEIYGLTYQPGVPLDEEAPFAPANPYAVSKAAADLALGELALRGLRLIRLRPVNHTGVGQSDSFVVPAFAKQLALIESNQQSPVMHVGALDRWRDFLDVRDVCDAYVAAVRYGAKLPAGTAINIASGTSRRIGDILDALILRTGLDVEIQTDAARLRPTDIEVARCNSDRARRLLDWCPMIAWDETLDSVMADWRARVGMEPRI